MIKISQITSRLKPYSFYIVAAASLGAGFLGFKAVYPASPKGKMSEVPIKKAEQACREAGAVCCGHTATIAEINGRALVQCPPEWTKRCLEVTQACFDVLKSAP